MNEDKVLARYQARLLELLAEKPPAAVAAELKADPALGELGAYADDWDPRMVELAAELLERWGRRG